MAWLSSLGLMSWMSAAMPFAAQKSSVSCVCAHAPRTHAPHHGSRARSDRGGGGGQSERQGWWSTPSVAIGMGRARRVGAAVRRSRVRRGGVRRTSLMPPMGEPHTVLRPKISCEVCACKNVFCVCHGVYLCALGRTFVHLCLNLLRVRVACACHSVSAASR